MAWMRGSLAARWATGAVGALWFMSGAVFRAEEILHRSASVTRAEIGAAAAVAGACDALALYVGVRLSRRVRITARAWPRALAAHLTAATGLAGVTALADLLVGRWLGHPIGHAHAQGFAIRLFYYATIVAGAHAAAYLRRMGQTVDTAARLRTTLARFEQQRLRAELRVLKAELSPQLLDGALGGVAALVHADPTAAGRVLAELASLMRDAVARVGVARVSVEDELLGLDAFEAAMHAEDPDVHIAREVEPDALDALVPHLAIPTMLAYAARERRAAGFAPNLIVQARVLATRDGVGGELLAIQVAGCGVRPAARLREVGAETVGAGAVGAVLPAPGWQTFERPWVPGMEGASMANPVLPCPGVDAPDTEGVGNWEREWSGDEAMANLMRRLDQLYCGRATLRRPVRGGGGALLLVPDVFDPGPLDSDTPGVPRGPEPLPAGPGPTREPSSDVVAPDGLSPDDWRHAWQTADVSRPLAVWAAFWVTLTVLRSAPRWAAAVHGGGEFATDLAADVAYTATRALALALVAWLAFWATRRAPFGFGARWPAVVRAHRLPALAGATAIVVAAVAARYGPHAPPARELGGSPPAAVTAYGLAEYGLAHAVSGLMAYAVAVGVAHLVLASRQRRRRAAAWRTLRAMVAEVARRRDASARRVGTPGPPA